MKNIRYTLICVILLVAITLSNTVLVVAIQREKEIIIDIPSRRLFLMEKNEVVKEYPIAVGKSYSQTPLGEYHIVYKTIDPYYSKQNIPGGSIYNPLGSRWIGFKPHYGIHGNSNPKSIGTFASAGCVRMYERDVQELYNQVGYYVPVKIQYELIKVKKDIDKENQILLVYPDYYQREKNLSNKIDERLKEINLYNKISKDRLKELKALSKKERTIFSDTYTFFINDMYITKDVIVDNNQYYVNREKIEKFFGIEFMDYFEGYSSFWGAKIEHKEVDNQKYISIKGLEKLFQGHCDLDKTNRYINYSIENLVLLNDKIVMGNGKEIINLTRVPINSFKKTLGIEEVKDNSTTKLIYQGKEIHYTKEYNTFYVSIEELEEKLDIKYDVHTANKYINLYLKPTIVYNGKKYKGEIRNREIYIPYSIIINENINTIGSIPAYKEINNTNITDINGIKYVKLSDVESLGIKKSSFYNTTIYLQRRIF